MRIKLLIAGVGTAALGLGLWAAAPIEGLGGEPSAREAPPPVQQSVAPPWSPRKQSAVTAPSDPSQPSPRARVEAAFDAALLDPHMTLPVALSTPAYAPETVPAPSAPPPQAAPRRQAQPFRCPHGSGENGEGLTLAEIARIKAALNLSPEQEAHWRPVEAALTDIAKRLAEGRAAGKTVVIAAERTQQIYFAAGPLVRSLRDAQKRDARDLACRMGLGAVAALI
jgi:hypothetical protein